jgi:phosphatidylglycerophosphatase A
MSSNFWLSLVYAISPNTMSSKLFNANISLIARHKADAKTILRNPLHFIAFGFGSGLSPILPASVGTLVALPLYWMLHDLSVVWYTGVVFVLAVLGIGVCAYTSRALAIHDHSGIVWDEIVGYLITMTAAPYGWEWMLLGFVLFRILDILKPWPISWLDRHVQGGLGIMLDDCLAGILACGILHIGSTLWTTGWN